MNPTLLFPSIWHRRAAGVTFMSAVVALGLLAYVILTQGQAGSPAVLAACGAAFMAAIVSLVAVLPVSDKLASWLSFFGFIVATGALGLALISDLSPNIHVIFVLVLSLLSLIAGMFGASAWLILIAIVAPSIVYHFATTHDGLSSGVGFILFYALPIVASFILWHGGPRRPSNVAGSGDTAYSTLAEQLNQVANESEIVISTIADGVIALNQKGEVQLINPAAASSLGWSKRDSIGLDYRSIVKLQDKQGEAIADDLNPITIALHTGKPLERSDLVMVTSANRTFQARISVTPVGRVGDGVIVVFRDITAEKAEEREQAEFVSTASHEMRTPVAAIEGYLGLSLNPATAAIDDKARMYLTKAHESAQHLGRLFQDLLDVTKADDGRLRNLPSVTDLVGFTGGVVTDLTAHASEKGLTLDFIPAHDSAITERKLTPVFYADVDNDHLREVLNNLIDNAIKYTKAGTVQVNVTGDTDSVEVTVRDSGIGIPREDIPHLFQKFYRVDNTDTREIGGTGLGLYLSRRLVELMNGKIWVESEYGHGSVFTISVPRLDFDTAQSRLRALAEQRERQAANEAGKH